MSNTRVNLLSPVLFYQTPIDILQTQNGSTQVNGLSNETNSCKGCNQNLASNNPASQYQRQKIIQNTVRVQSSLYTMNLAGLAGYQKPLNTYQLIDQAGTPYYAPPRVNWNQMSDRAEPSKQVTIVASGTTYHTSSRKHSITRDRPGAMSPGGIGVDIKHNSYERRLNKLKGKSVLRRGVIPPNYGNPIIFNKAYPIYGGKVVKTGIINNCDCPDIADNLSADTLIYGSESNAIQEQILSVTYKFNIGDYVWAKMYVTDTIYDKAQIINIHDNIYTIRFENDTIINTLASSLLIYYDCNCNLQLSETEIIVDNNNTSNDIDNIVNGTTTLACNLLGRLAASSLI